MSAPALATRADLARLLHHYLARAEMGDGDACEWFASDDFIAVCDALNLVAEDVFDVALDGAEAALEEQRVLDRGSWLARKHERHTQSEMATALGVSRRTIQKEMRRAGIAPRPRGRPRAQEAA